MPARRAPRRFTHLTVDDLAIEDERSMRSVPLYADLKEILRRDRYSFRLLPRGLTGRWDRALLLNLTFWNPGEGGDVLPEPSLHADVIAHVAWHHLCQQHLGAGVGRASSESLFFAEAIASAFDLYLVGRLLAEAPRSRFLGTQVPLMSETAMAAGLSASQFERLLHSIAADPAGSFESLRQLLFDATSALHKSEGADAALAAIERFADHPLIGLLHRFELSNWVLYARAYASAEPDREVRAIDRRLRRHRSSLDWLSDNWVAPRLA